MKISGLLSIQVFSMVILAACTTFQPQPTLAPIPSITPIPSSTSTPSTTPVVPTPTPASTSSPTPIPTIGGFAFIQGELKFWNGSQFIESKFPEGVAADELRLAQDGKTVQALSEEEVVAEYLNGEWKYPFLKTWQDIPLSFSKDDILEMANEYKASGTELGQLLNFGSRRDESFARIWGWSGYVNGVGTITQTINNKKWQILVIILAVPDIDKAEVANIPVTVCVGDFGSDECAYNYISENPTSSSIGTKIGTDKFDEVAKFLRDRTGQIARSFLFVSNDNPDFSAVIKGIVNDYEIFTETNKIFISEACAEKCYLQESMPPPDEFGYPGAKAIENMFIKSNDPWGIFIQGLFVYQDGLSGTD